MSTFILSHICDYKPKQKHSLKSTKHTKNKPSVEGMTTCAPENLLSCVTGAVTSPTGAALLVTAAVTLDVTGATADVTLAAPGDGEEC